MNQLPGTQIARFPVESGGVVQFARAIGDFVHARRVLDCVPPEGELAPPTYLVASAHFEPGYLRRPGEDRPWFGSGRESTGGPDPTHEDGQRRLHAEQHFEYRRPLRVGDVLIVRQRPGETWERDGRSGRLAFSETITDYLSESGELVVRARAVGVRVSSTDPAPAARRPSNSRERQAGECHDARTLVVVDSLRRTQIVQYAGASGDFHPLHTDEVFARDARGRGSVFAHGMLTMGLAGRVLTEWIGVAALESFNARFAAEVYPGDTLTARAELVGVDKAAGRKRGRFVLRTTDQNGQTVLTGSAVGRLD